jgi:hypothetical protein
MEEEVKIQSTSSQRQQRQSHITHMQCIVCNKQSSRTVRWKRAKSTVPKHIRSRWKQSGLERLVRHA